MKPVEDHDVRLTSLFWTFLKIGATAFGGFMALISVVQNYVVERRKPMPPEEMLDGISLATILRGPVAFNVVAYVGYKLRGPRAALITTLAVALPAFVLVVALSYAYFTWGAIPAVSSFFYGFVPAVAAIIVAAVWNMGLKVITGAAEAVLAAGACLLLLLMGGCLATLAVVAAAGAAGYLLFRNAPQPGPGAAPGERRVEPRKRLAVALPAAYAAGPLLSTDPLLAGKVLLTFAGMSLLLFGGGFVFIP